MHALALDPAYRRVSVEEFLAMDFGGARAELDDGLIYMMAGGGARHAQILGNIFFRLRGGLRGSGCIPYNSDFAVRTGPRRIRFPDVSVYCNDPAARENDAKQLLGDPQVVVEVLSPSTAAIDQHAKLAEYRALDGVREIVLVDFERERVRVVRRVAAESWTDAWLDPGADVALTSLGLVLPAAEIFARD